MVPVLRSLDGEHDRRPAVHTSSHGTNNPRLASGGVKSTLKSKKTKLLIQFSLWLDAKASP